MSYKLCSKVLVRMVEIMVLSAVFFTAAFATPDIRGDYENSVNAGYAGAYQVQDKNKVRVRVESGGSGLYFKSSLVAERWFGSTRFALGEYVPAFLRDSLENTFLYPLLGEQNIPDTMYLENAYLQGQKKRTILALGVQPVSWGSGYAWNPTDIWNTKDQLDPSYAQPGKMALRWEQGMGVASLTLVGGLEQSIKNSPVSAELKMYLGGFDWAITGARKYWEGMLNNGMLNNPIWENLGQSLGAGEEPGQNEFIPDSMTQMIFSELELFGNTQPVYQYTAGFWNSGQIAQLGLHSEWALHYKKTKNYEWEQWVYEILLGADYTLGVGNGVGVMAEYLYKSNGVHSESEYSIQQWMAFIQGRELAIGKHNGFLNLNYPHGLNQMLLSVIVNFSDGSLLVNPWYNVSITDNAALDIMVILPIGNENSQFGRNQYGSTVRFTLAF